MSEKLRSTLSRRLRAAVFGLAAGLLLLLSGDKASTAIITGIDPLEILKLQVRPNVLLVLDSSGSMRESLTSPVVRLGDDHDRAKMKLAKDTLRTFIQNNQTRVSFQFGIYNAQGFDNPAGTKYNNANSLLYMEPDEADRWLYSTTDPAAALVQAGPGAAATADNRGKVRRVRCVDLPDLPGETCDDANIDRNADGDTADDVDNDQTDFTFMDVDNTIVYLVKTKLFLNGHVVRWDADANGDGDTSDATDGAWCSTTAGTATNPPSIILSEVDSCGGADTGNDVTFTFQGIEGDWRNPSSACEGFFNLVPLLPCNDLDQFTEIGGFLQPSLLMSADGLTVQGYADLGDADGDANDGIDFDMNGDHVTGQPTSNGVRAGGFTPVGNSFADLKAIFNDMYNGGPLKPASLPIPIGSITPAVLRPRTYVIFLTDGDDTCLPDGTTQNTDDGTTGTANPANQRALHAAWRTQNLYTRINATDPASGVESFVILFGSDLSKARGDWIAYGGSGMTSIASTPFNTASRWATIPTAAQIAACATCRPAYSAANAAALSEALQDAISFAVGQGEFSASAPVVSTVFELVTDPDGVTPFNPSAFAPNTRYGQRVNILFQSTWELPEWKGRLFAFRNDGTFLPAPGANSLGIWEAGQTLFDKVIVPMRSTPGVAGINNRFTFPTLHGGATVANLSGALIKRRIFTTSRNGIWARSTTGDAATNPVFNQGNWSQGTNVVALWPPNQSGLNTTATGITDIDPAVGTAGPLDDELGIAALTLPQLQAIGACTGQPVADAGYGVIPTRCTDPLTQLDESRKEARQIVLGWMAGATLEFGTDGQPLRDPSPQRDLVFEDRGWLLADTVLAAIAVATPPLRFEPSKHISEFTLYRDGRRDASGQGIAEVNLGFGLRNPDFDDALPETKPDVKPVMSAVYLATNEMLHAFRAGPQCPPGGTCLAAPPTGYEQGSEELWGLVPYDQLGRALEYVQNNGQVTNPHIYSLAASLRVASIFMPSQTAGGFIVNGAPFFGRWRTVLYFGRGPGGRYLSAVDVTSPGTFTQSSATTNPPWVMWSRGNPDTQDGTTGGTQNNSASDYNAYLDMGQTWSIPAVGNVGSSAVPCDDLSNPEWRVWVGSGFADNALRPTEGKRFYMLDAMTGNVCKGSGSDWLLGDGNNSLITHNAVVAPPSGFNPRAQDPPGASVKDPIDHVTRIYIPDLHGRLWRYSNSSSGPGVLFDAGADQPFADGAALLKIGGLPHVYVAAGNDNRVPESEAPFMMFGLTDTLSESSFATPGTLATLNPSFTIDFPSSPPSNVPFRGTLQPATAFNDVGQGRVFYAGTRFNPAGISGSCISSFDTILFAVSGNNGGAVYDFTGDATADLSTILQGTRATGLSVVGGTTVVGDSGSLANAPTPTPDPSPTPTPGPPQAPYLQQKYMKMNSPVCRTP